MNSTSGISSGHVSASAAMALRASVSDKPERYSVLYARRIAAIASAPNPRRFSPSTLIPRGTAELPLAITYGGRDDS